MSGQLKSAATSSDVGSRTSSRLMARPKQEQMAILNDMRTTFWNNSPALRKKAKTLVKPASAGSSNKVTDAIQKYAGECSMTACEATGSMKEYISEVKADIFLASEMSIDGTVTFLSSVRDTGMSTTSSIYSYGLKAKWTILDYVNKALGNQTVEAAILIHEMHIYNMIQDYLQVHSEELGGERIGDVMDAILSEGAGNKYYDAIVLHMSAASTLFHFQMMGKSAVHDMNIRSTDSINPHVGRNSSLAFFHRDNREAVKDLVRQEAEENAARLDPRNPNFNHYAKYFALMIVGNVEATPDSNPGELEAYKYFGAPASMQEFVDSLITNLSDSIDQALNSFDAQFTHYKARIMGTDGSTGASLTSTYKPRIAEINKFAEEGMESIEKAITHMLGKRAHLKELGFDITDIRDMGAIQDMSDYAKNAIQDMNNNLPVRGAAIEAEIDASIAANEHQNIQLEIGSAAAGMMELANLPVESVEPDRSQNRKIMRDDLSSGTDSQDSTAHVGKKTRDSGDEREDSDDEGDMSAGGRRATRKRRSHRAAHRGRKTRRGRAAKKGRKSRRGGKARKAKKTRKGRKARKTRRARKGKKGRKTRKHISRRTHK